MVLKKIFVIDLDHDKQVSTVFDKIEPAGIAVDPKTGTIFVSSCQSNNIAMLDPQFQYLGTFLSQESFNPIGLSIRDNYLYVANCKYRSLLKVEFKWINLTGF